MILDFDDGPNVGILPFSFGGDTFDFKTRLQLCLADEDDALSVISTWDEIRMIDRMNSRWTNKSASGFWIPQ